MTTISCAARNCFNWATQRSVGTFNDARTKWRGPSLGTERKVVTLVFSTQLGLAQFFKSCEDSILYQRPPSPVRENDNSMGLFGSNAASLGTGLVCVTVSMAAALSVKPPALLAITE